MDTAHPDVMQTLLKDEVINSCRLRFDEQTAVAQTDMGAATKLFPSKPVENAAEEQTDLVPKDIVDLYSKFDRDEDDEAEVDQNW